MLCPRSRHRRLALALSGVAALAPGLAAAGDDEGFGGAPAIAPSTEDAAPDGAARSVFDTEPAPSRAEEEPASSASRQGAPTDTTSRTRGVTTHERVSTPFHEALDRAKAERAETPLSRLRDEVRALDEEGLALDGALRAGDLDADEHARRAAARAHRHAVLHDVEMMALRLRERCMRARGASAELPALLPRGVRLSSESDGVKLLLAMADPRHCEREVLVDDAVITRVERIHELERIVPELGYHRLAERRALERELEGLLDDLMGRAEDRPVELRFTTRAHDAKASLDALRPQGTLDDKRANGERRPITPLR